MTQADLVELADALGSAARDDGIGVVVLVDEMQDLSIAEMSAVCPQRRR